MYKVGFQPTSNEIFYQKGPQQEDQDSTPDLESRDDERQSKLPQKLMSNSELAMGLEEEEEHLERENAQIFLKSLKDELKHLTSARGTIDIDQRLQEFASKYCHGRILFFLYPHPPT